MPCRKPCGKPSPIKRPRPDEASPPDKGNSRCLQPPPEQPAGALFRALRHADVEAESAHAAVEEVRDMAGYNVVVEIGVRIDTRRKALRPLVVAVSATLLSVVGGGLFVLLKS